MVMQVIMVTMRFPERKRIKSKEAKMEAEDKDKRWHIEEVMSEKIKGGIVKLMGENTVFPIGR
uniref:Uncharacterized protein n=1 Tax=Romanomermis culicivorax TaxID=13658 RepID=A0A915JBS1_ROMCU